MKMKNQPLAYDGMGMQAAGGGHGPGHGNRLGGRSLSATAAMPQQPHVNGKIRKGSSAYAGVPTAVVAGGANANANGMRRPRTSDGQWGQQQQQQQQPPMSYQQQQPNGMREEEDMPLAVWQQQQRR